MHSLKVLEFHSVAARLRSFCETPWAMVAAENLTPSFDEATVWSALEETHEAHEAIGRYSPPNLGLVRDPREVLTLASKGATLSGQDLYRIGQSIGAMRALKHFLLARHAELPHLGAHRHHLPEQQKLEELLLNALESDGTVKDSASPALQTLRSRRKSAQIRIQERIQAFISGKTRELLSDPIYTVRDGRYVLPLKAENRGKIRGIVHDTSASGQTIYVEPEEVLQLGNTLREIEAAEREEVRRLYQLWSKKVGEAADELSIGVVAASQVDFVLAKARLGYDMNACLPERSKTPHTLQVHGGRHPLLEREKVVPLDIVVGKGRNVLITGPNTGGKTVAIKCVGLFVAMAQSGLMVPALGVQLAPFTQIWADIGDEQSLEQSLSTFSGHLKNIAEALNQLKPGALVLLDEVGSGTDPAEGAALARAILETFANSGAALLASTHFGELKAFAFSQEGFTNAAMEFDAKSLRPTYRLLLGAPGASQAMRIAERYGISAGIVQTAQRYMSEEAQGIDQMFARLETAQKVARNSQAEADRRLNEVRKAEQTAARKLREAEEIRMSVHGRANEVIEAALREIRLEASRLFDEIKSQRKDPSSNDRIREELRELDRVGKEFAAGFLPKRSPKEPLQLSKGAFVKLEGLTQVGTVVSEPKNGQVSVQMGAVKMNVPVSRLELAAAPKRESMKGSSNIRLQKTIHATTEIDLRHLRAEEAVRDLERFLDDAVLAGLDSIRVVHGKGEGILRKATQSVLKQHPAVATFRDGEPAEGGQGATVAVLG
jgi:DNA mismatch repair protein MutS2